MTVFWLTLHLCFYHHEKHTLENKNSKINKRILKTVSLQMHWNRVKGGKKTTAEIDSYRQPQLKRLPS